MTVDGKVTTRNFTPVDFTSREDKLHLFRQRALADAVLIGHSTLKRDNVRLGVFDGSDRIRVHLHSQWMLDPADFADVAANFGRIDVDAAHHAKPVARSKLTSHHRPNRAETIKKDANHFLVASRIITFGNPDNRS